MNPAYNRSWIYNLEVVKETKRWCKHHFISDQQFENIKSEYPSSLYNPSLVIRVLLFIATSITLSGIIGLGVLVMGTSQEALSIGAIVYGIISIFVLERFFIKSHHHFKSGVTEAVLYFAIGCALGGLVALIDGNIHVSIFICFIVFVIAAVRYLDLVCTIFAIGCFCCLLVYEFYAMDGFFRSIIPFVFIVTFLPVYLKAKKMREKSKFFLWRNNLVVIESLSALLIYAGGNYLVVRELSESMMNLSLNDGEDIPFAIIFYILTALIPILYLYRGIRTKDIVLMRISLLLVGLSAFTFKYYFSFGHPEITLTLAGASVLAITLLLLNYLKVSRHGYTRENLLSEKWADMNLEAFIISQTIGGNQTAGGATSHGERGGGGEFGGGGSTDSF